MLRAQQHGRERWRWKPEKQKPKRADTREEIQRILLCIHSHSRSASSNFHPPSSVRAFFYLFSSRPRMSSLRYSTYSTSPSLTGEPPYSGSSTRSPFLTDGAISEPSLERAPGPTSTTVAWKGVGMRAKLAIKNQTPKQHDDERNSLYEYHEKPTATKLLTVDMQSNWNRAMQTGNRW
jgi:hypothetical protein